MTTKKEKSSHESAGKERVVCYMSDAGKAKAFALRKEFRMSYGTIFEHFLTHYGASFKDKLNKQL